MFAEHSTQPASSSRAVAVALEDDEHDLDPEYAPKRAHTTKVGLTTFGALPCSGLHLWSPGVAQLWAPGVAQLWAPGMAQ